MLVTMTTAVLDYYVAELQEEGKGLDGQDNGVVATVAMTIDFLKNGIAEPSKELAP